MPQPRLRPYNWGPSFGGPIVRDRTHFFLSYDQTAHSQPFIRDIRAQRPAQLGLGIVF